MAIRDHLARLQMALRAKAGKQANRYFPFAEQQLDPSEAERLLKEASCDLERILYSHKGRIVHKWLQYPKIYEREFSRFRNTPVNLLELGVFKGGSLEIWRKYFGQDASITGVDINPDCAQYVDPQNNVFIGSQADPTFLNSVVDHIGVLDIVLDDGSHVAEHQRTSFDTLFPRLKVGGLYVIEDLHTAYWPGFYQGGYRRRGTAIEVAKALVDDMHGWYHGRRNSIAVTSSIASVRFYDSIVVIEKGDIPKPSHIQIGE